MGERPVKGGSDALNDLSVDEYAAFVGQIELQNIWLKAASVMNHVGPASPDQLDIRIESSAEWEEQPRGFRAIHAYQFRATTDGAVLDIDATFVMDFDSAQPMTNDIFVLFAEINLPVNSWPFLREYVSASVGRMGWMPITLPALKRGTLPPALGESTGTTKKTSTSRRGRKTQDS